MDGGITTDEGMKTHSAFATCTIEYDPTKYPDSMFSKRIKADDLRVINRACENTMRAMLGQNIKNFDRVYDIDRHRHDYTCSAESKFLPPRKAYTAVRIEFR
jgi:hypothetical protein